MPPFKRTNIYKAAEAMELVTEGKSTYQAATLTDLPQRTVHDIVAGKHKWKAIHNDPLFLEHRLQVKRSQQVAMNELIGKALCQIDAKLPDANALQSATTLGILFDKERLLAGEATQHVAVLNRHEIAGRSEALRNLLTSMGIKAGEVDGGSYTEANSGHGDAIEVDTVSNNEYPQANTDTVTNTTGRSFDSDQAGNGKPGGTPPLLGNFEGFPRRVGEL